MGLTCFVDSFIAFDGAYTAFDEFRESVAFAAGRGSWPPHDDPARDPNRWYWGAGYTRATHPGLYEFFCHSDCDGELSPAVCAALADELNHLLPALSAMGMGRPGGHIERAGGIGKVAERFIEGCRRAATLNRPLTFG